MLEFLTKILNREELIAHLLCYRDGLSLGLAIVVALILVGLGGLGYKRLTRNFPSQNELGIQVQELQQEIAELRETETRLRWKETLMHAIADASPLALYVVDNQTDQILYFNREFCKIWGIEHLAASMQRGEIKNNDIIPDCLKLIADIPAFAESCKPLQSEENRAVVEDEIRFTDKRIIRRFSTQIRDDCDRYFGRFYLFEDITDRKRTEAALQLANFSLECSSLPTLWINQDGKILQTNPAACQYLEYSREQLLSMQVGDIDPNFPIEVWPDHWEMLKQQKNLLLTSHHRTRSGKSIPVEMNLHYLEFNGQEYNFAYARDLTEYQRTEAALRESEARFHAFMDCSPAAAWITNHKGRIIYLSKSYSRMFRIPENYIVGKSDMTIYPDDLRREYLKNIHQVIETGQVIEVVESAPRADGTMGEFLVYKFPLPSASGQILVGGVAIDITERKKAEAALQRQEQEFRALIENAPDIIMRLNREGRYLYINPTVEKQTGIPASAFIGKTLREFGASESLTQLWQSTIEQVFETGEEQTIEFESPSVTGLVYYASRIVPELDQEGNVQSILAIARNISDRIRAETTLRQSEERMQALLSAIPDLMFRHRVDGTYLDIAGNQSTLNISREELIGTRLQDSPIPETLKINLLNRFRVAVETSTLQTYEHDLHRTDGIHSYETRIVKSGADEVVCILRDITERKRTEANLRKYERIVAAISDGICLVSRDYTYQIVNQAYLNFHHKNAAAVIGHKVSEIVPPDLFKTRIKPSHERCLAGETVQYELWLNSQKGDPKFLSVTYAPYFEVNGVVSGVVVSLRNLTELKKAQKQLELQDIIVKNMAEGICLVKASDGSIVYANPKAEQMFGYPPGGLNNQLLAISQGQLAIANPLNCPTIELDYPQLADTLEDTESTHSYEIRNLQREGKPFWYRVTLSKFEHPDHGTAYVAVQEDITERKQAEIILQQALAAAQAASLAKSRFLSNMSHELRTPLNAILGFSQMMARSPSLSLEHKEQLRIINRSGEHLLNLIDDILSMSKIEAGQVKLHETCFDLEQLLDNLEQMLRLKAVSKGLQFIFERAADIPQYIQTDDRKLRQILINLLSNAIKFTKIGSVVLRVSQEKQPKLHTEQNPASPDGRCRLKFQVEDTGLGIAPAELDTLFNPFVQTETGRTSLQGTGLGLAISQQYVQLMGGKITVRSQLGQGSTFSFDIGVKAVTSAESPSPCIPHRVIGLAPHQPPYRILVVEDVEENRLLLVQLLQSLGFQVRSAVNGQEALALWANWKPHLIWMDMRMPVMDGYEATRQIKAREQLLPASTLKTAIIAITASAFEEERASILAAGCSDLIRKPFKESEVLEKMAQYLGVRYIYEQDTPPILPPSGSPRNPTAQDLSQMSPEWMTQFQQAVLCANEPLILELIAQIPEPALVQTLTDWVKNFRLDLLFELLAPTDE